MPRKWERHEEGILVTREGFCVRCPECGELIPIVSEKYDECPACGWLCRVLVETRPPMEWK